MIAFTECPLDVFTTNDHHVRSEPSMYGNSCKDYFMFRLVEPPPAGAGGSHKQRDLPELLTRDDTILQVARKRFPPPAVAGGIQGAGLKALSA